MGFKRRGYLGSCALTVLGLAKGVTPVVSVTGKRVREHAGLRVPCGGLRLPLWLRGLVWYLGGAFIPTRPPSGAPVLKLRACVADA